MDEQVKKEYNDIPVHYCTTCLSLAIMGFDDDTLFCNKCGSTKTATTNITEWELIYEKRRGTKFLNN